MLDVRSFFHSTPWLLGSLDPFYSDIVFSLSLPHRGLLLALTQIVVFIILFPLEIIRLLCYAFIRALLDIHEESNIYLIILLRKGVCNGKEDC